VASPDGKKVAIGGIPAVTVWDTNKRQQIASLGGEWLPGTPEKRRQTWPRIFSPDGSKLLTMYWESGHWHLRVWDLNTGVSRRIFSGSRYMEGVRFSPDSRTLYVRSLEPVPTANWKFFLSAWNLRTGERQIIAMSDREFRNFAISPDGHLLAYATLSTKKYPGDLFLWDLVENKQRLAIPSRNGMNTSPSWPTGDRLSPLTSESSQSGTLPLERSATDFQRCRSGMIPSVSASIHATKSWPFTAGACSSTSRGRDPYLYGPRDGSAGRQPLSLT